MLGEEIRLYLAGYNARQMTDLTCWVIESGRKEWSGVESERGGWWWLTEGDCDELRMGARSVL